MPETDWVRFLDPVHWGTDPFNARSLDCTPLYVARYTGPRRTACRTAHDYWELTAVLDGEGFRRTRGATYRLLPGVVVLVPPGLPHREDAEGALDTIWIGGRGARFDALNREPRWARNPGLTAEIERLWLLGHRGQGGCGPEMDARLLLALADVYREPVVGTSGGAHDVIERILGFLHVHMAEPVTLAQLARRAGCSPGHFSRLFRRHTGNSVIQWLLCARVRQAAHLLRDSGLTVTEIAQRVGIPDLFYFSRRFKRQMGCSPRAYRRAWRTPGPNI